MWRHVGAAALTLLLALGGCDGAPREPVSILLVTLDTTRPDHLSYHGYGRPTSPTLDALAARGAWFDEAWAQAPVTGPSLASVLTARRAPVTGVRGNAEKLPADLPTLATVAQGAGLRTAAFVSTTLLRADVCAFDRGFATYDDEMTDPCFGHARAQRVARTTIDRAVAWLRKKDGPFLLWVHLYDPHGPYTPPEATARLAATRGDLPRTEIDPRWIPRYQRIRDVRDAGDYVDRYDGEIAYADAHLARLFAAVDADHTVIAVHADHGEALGEDGYWFRHGALLHDAALRIPLILAGPGVPSGMRVAAPVRNLDLAPTLLGLADLPPLPDAEGRDLTEWIGGRASPPPFESIAEARYREDLFDFTGVDTRWKLRYRAPGVDLTWWPADDAVEGATDDATTERVLGLLRAWIDEPPRPAAERRVPGQTAEEREALESLGYR